MSGGDVAEGCAEVDATACPGAWFVDMDITTIKRKGVRIRAKNIHITLNVTFFIKLFLKTGEKGNGRGQGEEGWEGRV